ncbi:MAG TPA: PAS domain S-box protein [Bryobacteraceae bacterium]|nr:PAS domain S-box protein [Bryobacteraceae bacterium]
MSVVTYPGTAADLEVGRLRTLYHLLTALSKATALEEIYAAALAGLLEATGADRAAILLFDDDDVMRFKAAQGLSQEYQQTVAGESPWHRGEMNASPVLVADVFEDPGVARFRDAFAREGIRAVAFIPLALEAGVFGKLMLCHAKPHETDADELEVVEAIGAHIALATDRKRAEFARLASEQRLRAIVDNSPAVIFLKDTEGRFQLVNRRFTEIFPQSSSGMAGKTDYELFDAGIADALRANDLAVIAAGGPISIEEYVPQSDGVHTYISVKFPVQTPDGAIAGICGIATDITERKQLELASQRLAAIVESSDDAIISKDLNGIVTSWNSGAERIFQYTAAEMVGSPVAVLADPDRRDEMPTILARIRRGERVEHYDTRRRRKDGVIIDIALTVSPVRDSSGNIIGASKIARDITPRKRREQERLQLLAREQEARRTAELLNQAAPRLAAQLDGEKLVQEITDIATRLVGAEFGAFYRKTPGGTGETYTLEAIWGAERDALDGFVLPALHGEGVVRCEDSALEPAAGPLAIRSYLAIPVVAHSGEVFGILFFGHELPGRFTQNHEAILTGIAAQAAIALDNARLFEQNQWSRTELTRTNEELRRANKDLELFAYSASHDLQEPVRNIAISAQLIERSWGRQLEGDDALFLNNILGASKRMGILIQDLLAYTNVTKSEEGPPLCPHPGRILADVLGSLRGPIEETGAEITAGPLPAVAIHESRMAQLFINLIGNALKYRAEGRAPRVRIRAEERDGVCIFSVTDNGIGIEAQYADQIFGLFKRLHGRENYPGSGIGLSICQRIVELYGGRIWLERSAPGEGSTFCFSLPSRS